VLQRAHDDLRGKSLARDAGRLPDLAGLEKPCSYEKRNACHRDHLLERTRRDNSGAVACACLRLLIAWQAEDREQGQARDGAYQTDFRDHLEPIKSSRLSHHHMRGPPIDR
jgi:hypothetical protein